MSDLQDMEDSFYFSSIRIEFGLGLRPPFLRLHYQPLQLGMAI